MSDDVENIDEALLEDMGKGYRFRPFMQVVLVAVVILVTALFLYIFPIPPGAPGFLDFNVSGNLTITTLVFCWVLAFLVPFIAKTRTHRVKQISMGLFFAALFSLTATIVLVAVDQAVVGATSIALLVAFLVGIGAQLYEHLNPEMVRRSMWMYLSIFVISAVFFVCVWIYMEALLAGWGIWISIVVSALFAYALLPEKPK